MCCTMLHIYCGQGSHRAHKHSTDTQIHSRQEATSNQQASKQAEEEIKIRIKASRAHTIQIVVAPKCSSTHRRAVAIMPGGIDTSHHLVGCCSQAANRSGRVDRGKQTKYKSFLYHWCWHVMWIAHFCSAHWIYVSHTEQMFIWFCLWFAVGRFTGWLIMVENRIFFFYNICQVYDFLWVFWAGIAFVTDLGCPLGRLSQCLCQV